MRFVQFLFFKHALEHKEEYPDAELTMKLHEAEEAVKNEKAWLSLDELKNQVEQ